MKIEKQIHPIVDVNSYDLVLKGGWIIDPSQSLNGRYDIAICNDRIVAVSQQLPLHKTKQTILVEDYLICPGFIDLHTHVYEWATSFSLAPDDIGIHSGATTIVDQGSTSRFTFNDFKSNVVDKVKTDVRCFTSLHQAAHSGKTVVDLRFDAPENVNVEALVRLAKDNPKIVSGFKIFAESGFVSRWNTKVFELAREVRDKTNLPLYVHTGELFPVVEDNRPLPESVVEKVVGYMKAGDLLAHCYSSQEDGIMGTRTEVPKFLIEAVEQGILLDLGYGLKFSFDIAERMMKQGVLPYTISSDVHGNFAGFHDDSTLNYSLCGAISKLMALGLDMVSAIAKVTINPARVLKAEAEIGTLKVGSRADITIVELVKQDWLFSDSSGRQMLAKERIIPVWVVREGELIQPHCRLLKDLKSSTVKSLQYANT